MNTMFKHCAPALALLGLALSGCQPELESPKYSAGSADFSRYIAVGNSLTAGFMDGGLSQEGQLASYPAQLSQQFIRASGGTFVQPLFTDAQSNGSGYLRLQSITAAGPVTVPVTNLLALRTAPPAAPLYTKFTDRINNLGVPGIRMSDIETPGYGSVQGNPYFERITPDATPTQTYRQRVAATVTAINPTFFTFWLGNNDVLGYATNGGVGAANAITSTATFTARANGILDDLTANGAKGLVGLIPNVTDVPYFKTVLVADVKARLRATPSAPPNISLYVQATGPNNTVVTREATDTDLLTLPASAVIGTATPNNPFPVGAGVAATAANPLPNQFVLDPQEQEAVRLATVDFNNVLRAKAEAKGLAIFDANTFFSTVARTGYVSNGVNNTASYITGNLFSLDGVHPTPRGYAIIANEMIKVINAKYGSTLSQVNPNAYRGVRIP